MQRKNKVSKVRNSDGAAERMQPDVMGGPQPASQAADLMKGPRPSQSDTDLMGGPQPANGAADLLGGWQRPVKRGDLMGGPAASSDVIEPG